MNHIAPCGEEFYTRTEARRHELGCASCAAATERHATECDRRATLLETAADWLRTIGAGLLVQPSLTFAHGDGTPQPVRIEYYLMDQPAHQQQAHAQQVINTVGGQWTVLHGPNAIYYHCETTWGIRFTVGVSPLWRSVDFRPPARRAEDVDHVAPSIGDTCCGKCPGDTCYVDRVTGA